MPEEVTEATPARTEPAKIDGHLNLELMNAKNDQFE